MVCRRHLSRALSIVVAGRSCHSDVSTRTARLASEGGWEYHGSLGVLPGLRTAGRLVLNVITMTVSRLEPAR